MQNIINKAQRYLNLEHEAKCKILGEEFSPIKYVNSIEIFNFSEEIAIRYFRQRTECHAAFICFDYNDCPEELRVYKCELEKDFDKEIEILIPTIKKEE